MSRLMKSVAACSAAMTLKTFTVCSVTITLITIIGYKMSELGVFLTLAITFGTISYHLCMRLLVGMLFKYFMNNHADYEKKWYQPFSWEMKLYQFLNVKKWKDKLPTYSIEAFQPDKHSWHEIAQAMCQAELVHEANMILSFLPVYATVWFGAFGVFLCTSIAGAVFDLVFVIIQRYNHPRVIKIVRIERKKALREKQFHKE